MKKFSVPGPLTLKALWFEGNLSRFCSFLTMPMFKKAVEAFWERERILGFSMRVAPLGLRAQ